MAAGYARNIPWPDTTYAGFSGGVRDGEAAPFEDGLQPACPLKADELIAQLAERYPGEISVLTIGSMTNMGQLLTRFPGNAAKLKQIISNGGNFSGAAHNIGCNLRYDPIAARIVARGDVPWVLLSESTSRYCSPRAEDVDRLRASSLPTAKLLVEAIDWWHKNKPDATPLPHVSDLNVFAYLLGGWVETVPGHVYIEIGPSGTLPGFRVQDDPKGKIMLGGEIPKDKGAQLRKYSCRGCWRSQSTGDDNSLVSGKFTSRSQDHGIARTPLLCWSRSGCGVDCHGSRCGGGERDT